MSVLKIEAGSTEQLWRLVAEFDITATIEHALMGLRQSLTIWLWDRENAEVRGWDEEDLEASNEVRFPLVINRDIEDLIVQAAFLRKGIHGRLWAVYYKHLRIDLGNIGRSLISVKDFVEMIIWESEKWHPRLSR